MVVILVFYAKILVIFSEKGYFMKDLRLEIIKLVISNREQLGLGYHLDEMFLTAKKIENFVENGEVAIEKPFDKDFFDDCVKSIFDRRDIAYKHIPFYLEKAKIYSETLVSGKVPTVDEVCARLDVLKV